MHLSLGPQTLRVRLRRSLAPTSAMPRRCLSTTSTRAWKTAHMWLKTANAQKAISQSRALRRRDVRRLHVTVAAMKRHASHNRLRSWSVRSPLKLLLRRGTPPALPMPAQLLAWVGLGVRTAGRGLPMRRACGRRGHPLSGVVAPTSMSVPAPRVKTVARANKALERGTVRVLPDTTARTAIFPPRTLRAVRTVWIANSPLLFLKLW